MISTPVLTGDIEASTGGHRYELVEASQAPTSFAIVEHLSESAPELRIQELEGDVGDLNLRLARDPDEPKSWTPALERRFADLAAAKAEKLASKDDLEELQRLVIFRRLLSNPRSFEEIRHGYYEQKLLSSLLEAAQDYVTFISSTD